MNNEDNDPQTEIPESVLHAMKEVEGTRQRLNENIAGASLMFPKIPEGMLQIMEDAEERKEIIERMDQGDRAILSMVNPDAIREQNAWERHKEILDIQNAFVGIQGRLLEEQKSGSKMAKWILILTIVLTVVTIILMIIALVPFFTAATTS